MDVFDSSVWVALFMDSDVHHAEALAALAEQQGSIYVPYIAMQETATVLTYKCSKQQADRFINFLLNDPRIIISHNDGRQDAETFLRHHQKMSFADISITAFAQRMGLRLVTFDKQMLRVFRQG